MASHHQESVSKLDAAFQHLIHAGLVTATQEDGETYYSITPKGQALMANLPHEVTE